MGKQLEMTRKQKVWLGSNLTFIGWGLKIKSHMFMHQEIFFFWFFSTVSKPFLAYVLCAVLSRFRCVWLFATVRTVAHQAPLSMALSSQEHWSGLPCPPPGDLPDPEVKPISYTPALAGRFFTTNATWKQNRWASIWAKGCKNRISRAVDKMQITVQILALSGVNHITLGTLPGINHVTHVTFLKFSSP